MSFLEILLIAVALSMDAFAVALAAGMAMIDVTWRQTARLAWHFGLFQGLMPILGWFGGVVVRDSFLRFGHWIVFALLVYCGAHMCWEARRRHETESCQDPTQGTRLIILSIATSIDALAAGFSLAVLHVSIWLPAAIIGAVALIFTALGMRLGKFLGCRSHVAQYAEILGGLILVSLGAKILCQAF